MKYSIKITWKRLKQIPRKFWYVWTVLGLLSLYCTIQLCIPVYHSLNNLQEYQISIDSVRLFDSHDTKGKRMKLQIADGETVYYLWYPQSHYADFAKNVEGDLLSGCVTSVTAKISGRQTIRDHIGNQKRIVDLRSKDAVYYDLETEKLGLRNHYAVLWLIAPFMVLVWVLSTVFIFISYNVIRIQKKKV